MVEVVAALIWQGDKFMICQRPAHKARGLLWEFVGGKVEQGETGEEALTRECREELGCEVKPNGIFARVIHTYPDIEIGLTVYYASIVSGEVQKLEHNAITFISPEEIPLYNFCPADKELLEKIRREYRVTEMEVVSFIEDYMSSREHNSLREIDLPAFDTPLVGFSSGGDELYPFYKKHIGEDFYRLPSEWLSAAYGREFAPEEVSVVSWVLPQTEDTKRKTREKTDCPPMEWEHARVHGEECNRELAKAVETFFRNRGIPAVAPMIAGDFTWQQSERFLVASNWSERHTALISGLGTFGLCDGLITEKGKAVRLGSVIVARRYAPTPRSYTAYNEYCMASSGCTACMNRCPAGAITPAGHDKTKCMAYHKEVIAPLLKERYNYEGYAVCGLCQTGVPCENCPPAKPETGDIK